MLSDLVAPQVKPPVDWRPAITFDEVTGEGIATTQGLINAPDFDEFLRQAGYDPDVYEVVGNTVRTSKWQQREGGDWLTAYRFTFKLKNPAFDLPLLYKTAKAKVSKPKPVANDSVFVVVPADWQIGKVASRGNTEDLIARLLQSFANIDAHLSKRKYERILMLDAGDLIEGIENVANLAQLQSNDLSPMQQVDLGITLMWELLTMLHKHAPVTYASVGSNHCQMRVNKQRIGRPGVDDWGIFVLQQIKKLADVKEMDVQFLIPDEYDETLVVDPFGDKFHVVGLFHGHQANRPNNVQSWLEKQTFGQQPLQHFTIAVSGHFHHTRVEEIGLAHNGGSRWWIQASTADNGSDWYRLTSGNESGTGITTFELHKNKLFTGTINRF